MEETISEEEMIAVTEAAEAVMIAETGDVTEKTAVTREREATVEIAEEEGVHPLPRRK